MSSWFCPSEKTCPFVGEPFCGHGMNQPTILSYHTDSSVLQECYVAHALNSWNEWLRLRDRWEGSMKRILDVVLSMELDGRFLQDMFSLLILHHDIGKLANEYQTRDFYRHEALSAHILYHQFVEARQASEETDLLAAIFAAATYLHHEALQISHNHFEMREPTYSYLLNWLSPWEYHMVEMSDELLGQLNKRLVPTCVIAPFSLKNKLIAGREVAMTLASVMTAVDGCAEPLAVRMAVASVLHPLTICDNRAANMRGGVPSVFSTALMEYLIEGAISGDEQ